MINELICAIRDKLIKALGGVPKSEVEDQRAAYEKWATEHLTGKNGEVTPDVYHYDPFDGDDIVVIRSRISISGARITGLKVAPWCRGVTTYGLDVSGRLPTEELKESRSRCNEKDK